MKTPLLTNGVVRLIMAIDSICTSKNYCFGEEEILILFWEKEEAIYARRVGFSLLLG